MSGMFCKDKERLEIFYVRDVVVGGSEGCKVLSVVVHLEGVARAGSVRLVQERRLGSVRSGFEKC